MDTTVKPGLMFDTDLERGYWIGVVLAMIPNQTVTESVEKADEVIRALRLRTLDSPPDPRRADPHMGGRRFTLRDNSNSR